MLTIDHTLEDLGARLALAAHSLTAAAVVIAETQAESLKAQAQAEIARRFANGGPRLVESLQTTVRQEGEQLAIEITSDRPFFGVLEDGLSGTEQVRSQLRRMSIAFGHPMTPHDVLVRDYSRAVNLPAHHVLSTVQDAAPSPLATAFQTGLSAHLAEVL